MTMLFETSGCLSPAGSRSHISFTIFLQEPIDRLAIDFSYTPKIVADPALSGRLRRQAETRYSDDPRFPADCGHDRVVFNNLLTLSFDDARGFRGAAHRHAAEQHLFFATDAASSGLVAGVVPAGLFRVTLSAHAVLTGTCDYRLSVYSEES